MCLPGNIGSFQDFPRKLAKVYFRHVDAAKEKRHIAKGSRKRWLKGRQNRTQSIGVSATAQMPLYSSRADCAVIWVARKNAVSWMQEKTQLDIARYLSRSKFRDIPRPTIPNMTNIVTPVVLSWAAILAGVCSHLMGHHGTQTQCTLLWYSYMGNHRHGSDPSRDLFALNDQF